MEFLARIDKEKVSGGWNKTFEQKDKWRLSNILQSGKCLERNKLSFWLGLFFPFSIQNWLKIDFKSTSLSKSNFYKQYKKNFLSHNVNLMTKQIVSEFWLEMVKISCWWRRFKEIIGSRAQARKKISLCSETPCIGWD